MTPHVQPPPVTRRDHVNSAARGYSDPSVPISRRPSTVIAPQALFMMNSPLIMRQAELFAKSLLEKDSLDEPGRIEAAYIKAYSRPPRPSELAGASAFLAKMKKSDPSELSAWKNFCHMVMASSEFIYVN